MCARMHAHSKLLLEARRKILKLELEVVVSLPIQVLGTELGSAKAVNTVTAEPSLQLLDNNENSSLGLLVLPVCLRVWGDHQSMGHLPVAHP